MVPIVEQMQESSFCSSIVNCYEESKDGRAIQYPERQRSQSQEYQRGSIKIMKSKKSPPTNIMGALFKSEIINLRPSQNIDVTAERSKEVEL